MTQTPVAKLTPFDERKECWRVVIETPQGSHNKYKYDDEFGLFLLNGVLPEGMAFPYDFGFIPATLGADGDPLDVLLLMDQPAFCGCLVPSRLIGVIEAEQTEKDGTTQRNDRVVAVPVKCRVFSDCRSLKDLNQNRLHEITEFFVSYNRIHGKEFNVLDIHGPRKAEQCAQDAMKRARKAK